MTRKEFLLARGWKTSPFGAWRDRWINPAFDHPSQGLSEEEAETAQLDRDAAALMYVFEHRTLMLMNVILENERLRAELAEWEKKWREWYKHAGV